MKKYILLMAACMLVAQSCNDDFLDRFPKTEIAKENFFNNAEDLSTYLYGVYDFPGFGIYYDDMNTDNAATTGQTELKNMMLGNPTPSTITGGWSVSDWEQLRKVNFFLENFNKADLPQERLDHFEGVGRFFRAKFYMQKVKRFSDVPYYDKVLETGDPDLFKARDPRTEVVDKIFEDYAFAAEHVDDNDYRAGIVNKWVVRAYQARHALHEGTFRKYHDELSLQSTANTYLQLARDAAKDIIDNGGYAIHNTGNPMEDYGSLFNSTSLQDNTEVILGRFADDGTLGSGWTPFTFGNYEENPSKDLLQAYLMDDGTPYTNQVGYQTNLFVEEFQNRDPRLYQTYAYPGWELINSSTYAQGEGVYVQELNKNFSGYHMIKAFINNTSFAVQNSADVPVVRLAEILLIYAEARAELGELTQADLDMTINVLRDRAGMPHLTMAVASDPVLVAKYPNVTGAQATLIREIRRERRVELAMEGFRFDDLMRWEAGKLIEIEPEGLYFPSLGNYDLTGDGVDDIKLIADTTPIPADEDKEVNSLGVTLKYYQAGLPGSNASVYLTNGTSGTIVTDPERGTFSEPKYYYRPVPQSQVIVNPNLTQIFGW